MAIPFSRSARSLEADSFRFSAVMLVASLLLLTAWGLWFFFASISLYEVSETARVEVRGASHAVAAPVSGRVVATHISLGRRVEAGDLLLELDPRTEELQLAERQSARRGSESELTDLSGEIASEEKALAQLKNAARLEVEELEASLNEAEAAREFAVSNHAKVLELKEQGVQSVRDLEKAKSEMAMAQAIESQRRTAVARRQEQLRIEERDRRSDIEGLHRQASQLRGSIDTSERTEERLEVELGLRSIRAPVSGTVAKVAESLLQGAYVAAGDQLCSIVPESDGGHVVVAEFEPGKAVGRIRAGQRARLRLDGYPWTHYGSVEARVSNVDSEARDGRVRVEFSIEPGVPAGIVLEHGLPGELEVEVESPSPLGLVLRSVGRLVEGA